MFLQNNSLKKYENLAYLNLLYYKQMGLKSILFSNINLRGCWVYIVKT